MSLGSINLDEITNVLVEMSHKAFRDATDADRYFTRFLPRVPPSEATGCSWLVKDTKQTARGFQEGGTFGAPSKFTKVKPFIAKAYFETSIRLTGHMRDSLATAADIQIQNYFQQQLAGAASALEDEIEEASIGGIDAPSGFVGIQEVLSATNTYAGIDRTIVSRFQAAIVDGGAALVTLAKMEELDRKLISEHRGRYNVVLADSANARLIAAFTANDTDIPVRRLTIPEGGTAFTPILGVGHGDLDMPVAFFKGRPVYELPNWPTGIVAFLQVDGAASTLGVNLGVEVFRAMTVGERDRVNDDDIWPVTIGVQMRCQNPYKTAGAIVNLI